MWTAVELRELRIFLTLADELHFGRTAERLHISQPGVSEHAASVAGPLRIGFTFTTDGPSLHRLIDAFQTRHPRLPGDTA
jgi:hypothetical protein